jgi:hypothetical protein
MNRIRIATEEEIKSIAPQSDLDETCLVLALDSQVGPAFAVVRQATEVDPVIYPDKFADRMKAIFQRDIETVLTVRGAKTYYFNVHADNEPWLKVAETFGAVRVSTAPEYRLKVKL